MDGPAARARALTALEAEVFDLLVVGGGSVGAGVALQAAARGLRVALLERDDWGSGTSSRSTKLVHGGVRYLERAVLRADRAEYGLVREALRERAAFFRQAPHLTRRLAILTPAASLGERLYLGAGLTLYDLLAGTASLGRTRHLSAAETVRRFPSLAGRRLAGSVLYHDGQFDDARFNLALALTAAAHGAVTVNHASVTGLLRQQGRVVGVRVRDTLSGAEPAVRARVVLNATGPFGDALRALDDPAAAPLIRPSAGVHLVLRPGIFPPDTGLLVPRTSDGRVVFVLPWLGHTLIGTTDRPEEPAEHPTVPEADITYLLQVAARHTGQSLSPTDIRSAWSGQRPLVRDPARQRTAELARGHLVTESASGLVTVTGGKWTSYRRIAADALEYVLRRHAFRAGPAWPAEEVVLIGGEGYSPALVADLRQRHGLPADVAEHLGAAYGDRMGAVCALAAEGYGARLAPGHPHLEAEVLWAARQEGAATAMDVLARRTRLAFLDRAAARACLPRVLDLLGQEFAWSPPRRRREEAEAAARLDAAL